LILCWFKPDSFCFVEDLVSSYTVIPDDPPRSLSKTTAEKVGGDFQFVWVAMFDLEKTKAKQCEYDFETVTINEIQW
jgi:hypothetical protein